MTKTATTPDEQGSLAQLDRALESGKISASAAQNVRTWLSDPQFAPYASLVTQHIRDEKWRQLDDVFWTVIPFGTGGRRGKMYPIGTNAINDRTIGESAQGLVQYVKRVKPQGPWACAIAYDTRHRSRDFAERCAGIMVSGGFTVYFIDDYRSTPELSFLVRYKNCDCGIMVTASHNPPSDNAVKVYWSNGAQLVPPHDQGVIAEVGNVRHIRVADFADAVRDGTVILCRAEIDQALLREHLRLSVPGPRDLKVIYSPLHGVGEFNVRTLFQADGFGDLEIYEPHRKPDGDFPNVPDHVSNPENPAVFDAIVERAKLTKAELILATDPDCDRMGCAAPVTTDPTKEWATFNGNQLSSLLADFVLSQRRESGRLSPENYVVTTLVTTPLVRRIAMSYGVRCFDQNLVGFKWICDLIDRVGAEDFVYATEESHGFLVGTYCRDKDGAIACLLMGQLAALCKAQGQSVHQRMDNMYRQFGLHSERQINLKMEGSDGMRRMQTLMNALRTNPPSQLGELAVASRRDYLTGQRVDDRGNASPLEGPKDNLIFLETSMEGNYVAIRPSGTEPKVKFYMFTHSSAAESNELNAAKKRLTQRLAEMELSLRSFADAI